MSGIRIENKDIYRIEVNDNGDCIEFDLRDIGLKVKLFETLEKIEEIEKKYNELFKNVKTEKEETILEEKMYFEIRNAMDIFLGKGACQKIFGDRNYHEMFDDLLEELTKKRPELNNKSHFDMLQLKSDDIRRRIKNKYNKKVKNVI